MESTFKVGDKVVVVKDFYFGGAMKGEIAIVCRADEYGIVISNKRIEERFTYGGGARLGEIDIRHLTPLEELL